MDLETRVGSDVFSVSNVIGGRTARPRLASVVLDAATGLASLQRKYRALGGGSPSEFLDRAFASLGIRWEAESADLARIPRNGPTVVVANHPFGGAEGMVLARALLSVRRDVRVMGNRFLALIPELAELFVAVDPFGGGNAAPRSRAGLRQAIRHLEAGGALAMFPAGEVASLDLRRGTVDEPAWSVTAARLAKRTGATVVPVFFPGRNGPLFQLAGLVHPSLRTALLPRQLLAARRRRLTLRVGRPVSPGTVTAAGDAELTGILRWRTRLLGHRSPVAAVAPARFRLPVAQPIAPEMLRAEIDSLPDAATLASSGAFRVIIARADEIPSVLLEIGRGREVAFRAAREGTGRDRDLDGFDREYLHLVLWDSLANAVAGAYRLGQTDVVCTGRGVSGLYTPTLFRFGARGVARIHPALEMGRSFIHPVYQRSHSALLLLWQGIGAFVAHNPRYRYLFGPVSISQEYGAIARELMVRFLGGALEDRSLLPSVRPRRPFPLRKRQALDLEMLARSLRDVDELSEIVADLEGGRGIPVLVRQYIRLGGRIASFNVDREFANVVDALVVVDLAATERKLLDRYMGKEGADRFLAFQRGRGSILPLAEPDSDLELPLAPGLTRRPA